MASQTVPPTGPEKTFFLTPEFYREVAAGSVRSTINTLRSGNAMAAEMAGLPAPTLRYSEATMAKAAALLEQAFDILNTAPLVAQTGTTARAHLRLVHSAEQ